MTDNQPTSALQSSGRIIRAFGLAVACLLAACAGRPATLPTPPWRAAELKAKLDEWRCQLPARCEHYRIRLIDVERASAEIDFSSTIILSRGFVLMMDSQEEMLFVLAHEIAHRELSHLAPRDLRKRLPLELAADTWARNALCAMGFGAEPGRSLLQRLHNPDAEFADEKRRNLALAEIEQRLLAWKDCEPSLTKASSGPRLTESAFRTLIARAMTTSILHEPAAAETVAGDSGD